MLLSVAVGGGFDMALIFECLRCFDVFWLGCGFWVWCRVVWEFGGLDCFYLVRVVFLDFVDFGVCSCLRLLGLLWRFILIGIL